VFFSTNLGPRVVLRYISTGFSSSNLAYNKVDKGDYYKRRPSKVTSKYGGRGISILLSNGTVLEDSIIYYY